MSKGYTSKPTVYREINFRSRLEARWAAMFDILGWAWEYEPETTGSGYIPDFLLYGQSGRKVYVEIKPLAVYLDDAQAIRDKADRGTGGAPLLVLTDQFTSANAFKALALGDFHSNDGSDWDQSDLALLVNYGDVFDFVGEYGKWEGALTGRYDGNAMLEGSLVDGRHLLHLWSKAGNKVQWKG